MIEWTDDAIVLSSRPHGESAAVVQIMTREHGRHAGLVRGARGRSARGTYEPGNEVRATWKARLAEHLGGLTCELTSGRAARWLDDPPRLAGISAACAIAEASLPEREPHPAVYDGMIALLDALELESWPAVYIKWELGVLSELGYGLDLESCAATGSNDSLTYVSPRTGRAVSQAAAEPYRDRLLPLPGFLLGAGLSGPKELVDGLKLTGHFLERHVFAARHAPLPTARQRLAERLGDLVDVPGA